MAKVVIFGVQDFAQLACFYLRHDSEHEVVGFSVHQAYLPPSGTYEGLPVVAFERIEETFEPATHSLFAPLSQRRMGRLRESVYRQIKAKGYPLISYVSSRATIFPGVKIGENCYILEDNTVQPFVEIGNNVVLWSGNHIGHHSVIKDHVLFTSHVVLSGHCVVEPYAFLGVNATVRDGVRIGEGSLIGMAAAVTRDTDPWGVYKGNPARKGDVPSSELDF
jgi:sugar O-acyltransferase (sialic acid O-acetyltransferase NeuD family)